MAKAGERGHGDYSVVTRDDGSTQWAYKGRPLYTWVKDTKPGDTSGDGVKNVNPARRPSPAAMAVAPAQRQAAWAGASSQSMRAARSAGSAMPA